MNRAQELLTELESDEPRGRSKRRDNIPPPQLALPLFDIEDTRLAQAVLDLDIGNLTPLEAINKLYELQQKARDP